MRVVAITEPGRVEVVERPDPRPVEELVLVRITSTPICTEYKGYAAGRTGDRFGHEAVGEVVEVAGEAAGETGLSPGDRVVVQPGYSCNDCALCRSGEHIHCEHPLDVEALTGANLGQASYAQYLLKPAWLLSPVPDGLDDSYAGMALCGLGPTFGALRQMGAREADTLLITGLGPVGLGGVINARHLGARVIAVESQPYRAALALELGAEVVLDPGAADTLDRIRELTDGLGVDMAIDCSGASAAHRLMVDAVRRKGQATFIGEGGEFPLAASRDMIRKGLLLRGNWHYNLDGYAELIEVVEASRDAIDRLITHRFPMSRVVEAWELQATGECGQGAAGSMGVSGDERWIEYSGYSGAGAGRKIVLVSGDEEYRSEEALPMLARMLAERHGFDCTVLFALDPRSGEIDPECQTNIPGLDRLDGADLLVLFTRFRELPDEQMRHLVDFVERGGPVIGLRTATHAFAYERRPESPYARYSFDSADPAGGFGRDVLGETWVAHHGRHGHESTRATVPDGAASHPIVRGVEDVWGPSDVYAVTELPGDAEVLLLGQPLSGMSPDDPPNAAKTTIPVAWARPAAGTGGSRVVCTTMGASVDLESEGLRRLLVNACYWCTGLEEAIGERAGVAIVGDYAPTMFGFGEHRRGLRPADLAR